MNVPSPSYDYLKDIIKLGLDKTIEATYTTTPWSKQKTLKKFKALPEIPTQVYINSIILELQYNTSKMRSRARKRPLWTSFT